MSGHRWSVGEVARASGLTVRALYHYDEIGLAGASERTASGHRRYTEADLRRLYRVRALRGLGLSLEEIGGVLAKAPDGAAGELGRMRGLLAAQLRALDAQAARIDELRQRVAGLLRQIEDDASMPGPDQFMTTLELMTVYETAFTPEQRQRLADRTAELGPEAVAAARNEFSGLVEEFLRHVEAGTPVTDPAVRELQRRWDAIGSRFHDGDEGITDAAQSVWRENAQDIARTLPWPPEKFVEVIGYVQRVRASAS
ncbi:MerR family transcriptional regulator [Streptomyces sp. NPDC007861]|uniref:MerR family transcriptional regulator n=1 Tax=Streptomyces sp. NPDC007861 TaxID=3154893 RepID=UPI0033CCF434